MGLLDEILAKDHSRTYRETKEEIATKIVEEAGLSEGAVARLSGSLLKDDLKKLLARLRVCNE